jgi:hypothetical protein
MGVYLISVDASEWFGEGEDGWGETAAALNAELVRRELPRYVSAPEAVDFVPGSGQSFEEKLVPRMDGFLALCQEHLSQEEIETICGWTILIPLFLDEEIHLPISSGYTESTTVAGAPQVLALAEKLAAAIDLPSEVPAVCDNLDLTRWFMDTGGRKLVAARPGPWSNDLDMAFYVALFLRAAQHSLRRGSPVAYS